jgi:hypothetical protein
VRAQRPTMEKVMARVLVGSGLGRHPAVRDDGDDVDLHQPFGLAQGRHHQAGGDGNTPFSHWPTSR